MHSLDHVELGEAWIRGEYDEHWAYERLIVDCPGGLYLGEALEDLCTSPGRGKLQVWEDGLESHEVSMDVTFL